VNQRNSPLFYTMYNYSLYFFLKSNKISYRHSSPYLQRISTAKQYVT